MQQHLGAAGGVPPGRRAANRRYIDEKWKDLFQGIFHRLTTDKHKHCNSPFIFLASSDFIMREQNGEEEEWRSPLGAFYKRSYSRQIAYTGNEAELHLKVKNRVRDVDKNIARLDDGTAAVWRSMYIGAKHYVVTKDSAIIYTVVPEVKEEANEINGSITRDIGRIIAVKEVVKDYLREAVTPELFVENNDASIAFRVGQSRVNQIEVEYYDQSKKKMDKVERIAVNAAGKQLLAAGEKFNVKPGGARWLRVRLRKDDERDSPEEIWSEFSYFVPIPRVIGDEADKSKVKVEGESYIPSPVVVQAKKQRTVVAPAHTDGHSKI